MMAKTFPTAADLDALSSKLPKLTLFKANVLRTTTMGVVEWERKDGKWEGGVQEGKGVSADRQMASGVINSEVTAPSS